MEIKKDKSKGRITFFDTTVNFTRDETYNQIKTLFKETIAENFINIYDLMRSESSPSFDNVELFLPTEL